MAFEITWEPRGVYKHFHGFVSYEEYARSQALVLGDARADDIRYVINDAREIEGYTGSQDQAEELAAFNYASSRSNPRIRIAYVTCDLRLIALIKVASLISSYELAHFPTLEAARAWAMKGTALFDTQGHPA